MSEERPKGERASGRELGSAPTTPAPPGDPTLAIGSHSPDSTLDMPPTEGGAIPEPGPGATIGRFIVKARIGAGGMGVVYSGEDSELHRPVAIKIVRGDAAEQPAYRQRLLREAQAMARLEHPNVVRVYEIGSSEGRTFVAMELVEGTTLASWLAQPHSWREVLAMFAQAGAGLAAAHRAGLVHRDFKPDNVLVDHSGRARVADFGLARIAEADRAAPPLTKTGVLMGTPGYMSPEQQLGTEVDTRADQYSFCVALREALGGRPLDETRWRTVPPGIRATISRGLSYDPDERFPSMDELIAALHAGARVREPKWLIALAVLAVLGGASAIVAYASSHGGDGGSQGSATRPVVADVNAGSAAVQPADAAVRAADTADIARTPAQVDPHAPAPPAPIDPHAPAPPAPPTPIDPHAPAPPIKRDPPAAQTARAPQMGSAAPVDVVAPAPLPTGKGPTTKHLPQSRPGAPGHLAVVRTAIRELGYDGVDVAALDHTPDDMQHAFENEGSVGTSTAAQIANVKLGMLERRRGNCRRALELWSDPRELLRGSAGGDASLWGARQSLGIALCQLADGDGDGAYAAATKAWNHGNRDQVAVVEAFALYERMRMDDAYQMLLAANRATDPRVQAALRAWLDGLGLGL